MKNNINRSLCVTCNMPVIDQGRVSCSEKCHEAFVKHCEEKFGKTKQVVDDTNGTIYIVSTREIIEKGLKWEDLAKYPTKKR